MNSRYIEMLLFFLFVVFYPTGATYSQTLLDADSTIRDASDFKELRIDPSVIEADSNFVRLDSVTYVYLETTKLSEISRIEELRVTANEYIIYDNNLDAIFIFRKDGKFKSKLVASKDFKRGSGFRINEYEQAIYVDDLDDVVIHKFDFDGRKIGEIRETEWSGEFDFHQNFRLNYYSFYSPVISDDGKHANLAIKNLDTEEAKGYLWYDSVYNESLNILANSCFFKSNGRMLIARELDNNIYSVSEGNVTRKWKVILPMEFSVPGDFLTNLSYNSQRFEYLNSKPTIFHKLNNVYETTDFLTFSFGSDLTYLYDKELDLVHDLAYIGREDFRKTALLAGVRSVIAVDKERFIAPLYVSSVKAILSKLTKSEKALVDPNLLEISEKSFFNPILVLLHIDK